MKNSLKNALKHHKTLIFFVFWVLFGIFVLRDFIVHYYNQTDKQDNLNFVLDYGLQISANNSKFTNSPKEPIFFDVPNSTKSAHSSAIVNIQNLTNNNNASLKNMLLYFAGSSEGAKDVCIYQSFFTQKNVATLDKNGFFWSEPKAILCRNDLSKMSGKFIKKLGNPVSFVDSKGRAHLFVVGVSMGGWATSKIYHFLFDSSLSKLEFVRELHLSPILNFSHLVRTPAMVLENGDFVLPIYNEFAQKYPILLHIDSSQNIQSVSKPIFSRSTFSSTRNQLQPSFVPLDFAHFFGVFRNYKGDNIMKSAICARDKRNRFDKCEVLPTNLQNFDFSSVFFRLDSAVLLLHNQASHAGGNHREELWLYSLQDVDLLDFSFAESSGHSLAKQVVFKPIMKLDELLDNEVSYPSVAVNDEFVHIAYTYGRKHIRTLLLPKAYILQKLANQIQSQNQRQAQ